MKREKVNYNQFNYNVLDANKSFFYVILSNIIASLVFGVICMLLLITAWNEALYNTLVGIFQVITIPLLFMTFIIIYHKKHKINFKSAIGISKNINPIVVLLIIVAVILCVICFFPLINMLYSAIAKLGLETSSSVGFEMNNWWQLLIGVVIYSALPAIMEEIIFRGMMLRGLLNKVKPYVAIVISALAFFIMHGSLIQSFYQIALGFILSLLGYYTGNIVYPIVFHFLNNLAVILMSYFNIGGFINGFSLTVGGFFAGFGLFVAGVLLIGAILLIVRFLLLGKKPKEYELVVNGDNIIIEENSSKLTFKQLKESFSMDEKSYFYMAWTIAIVLWILNSL